MAGAGPIHVLTLADDRYAMQVAVLVRSLLEHHSSNRLLSIKIVDGGFSAENRVRLNQSWQGATQNPARWEFVPPSLGMDEQAFPASGRIPVLTYARFMLNDYFSRNEERTVVLDSDTLALTDIAGLHDVELGTAAIGACVDPFIPTVSSIGGLADWQRLALAADTPYFNAGVMVVDLVRWNEMRVGPRALDFTLRQSQRLQHYDQDGLNSVLSGHWKATDSRWQTHPRLKNSLGQELPHDPWMLHFSGRLKPWLYPAGGPADQLFFECLDRTAWRGFRHSGGLSSLAYRLYDSPLRRITHPLEKRILAWHKTVRSIRRGKTSG